jgi:hypothetical protein
MGVRDELAKAITKGIRAFHSSPHDFERFDISKIGTGEGAQVYGHGLYFAENPAVSGQGGQYWDQFKRRFDRHEQDAADVLREHGFDRQEAAASIAAQIDAVKARLATAGPNANFEGMQAALRNWQAQHDLIAGGGPVGPRTYEVNIKADPATMLDWDKPLREQPMRGVLPDIAKQFSGASPGAADMYNFLQSGGDQASKVSGVDYYRSLVPSNRNAAGVSAALQEAGIPGIKYLDEGSRRLVTPQHQADIADFEAKLAQVRQTGSPEDIARHERLFAQMNVQPTSNYVMFPGTEDKIDILRKYGVVGAPAGALGATFDPSQYEAAP